MIWIAVWAIAVGLNAVPAFMPPTWAVLAYFHLYHALPTLPLAIVGALGATTGRAILALGSRTFGARFVPAAWRVNIEGLVETLQDQPKLGIPSLALFALGPLPSNHLFIAAGLAKAPLLPILLIFGVARCISYVLWISVANVADRSLRETLGTRAGGWGAIAVQLAGFGLILLAMRVDWRRVLGDRWPSTWSRQPPTVDQGGVPRTPDADSPGPTV